MKHRNLIFSALSFLLSSTVTSCNLFDPDDSQLISNNLLSVDLVKREYFEGETIDLSGLTVKGFLYNTETYVDDVDYTIRWESTGRLIQDGDIITNKQGRYYWIFSADTYHSYRLAISIYYPKIESVYIDSYPNQQYFSSTNKFTYDGLTIKRKITYSYKNEDGDDGSDQTRIYEVPLSSCSFTYNKDNQELPITNNFTFPEGTKGIFTVNIYTLSFQTNKKIKVGSYKINVTDSLSSTALSLNDFDESTITKYQSDDTITLTITNEKIESNRQTGTNNYISPDNLDNSYGLDYYSTVNDESKVLCPSKGDVPVLVIPLYYNEESSTDLLTNENLNLIEKCFFGNSDDLFFESLRSYYYKSSYGKLNFYGKVMQPFNPQTKVKNLKFSNGALAINSDGSKEFQSIIKEALEFVKTTGIDLRDYDSNADGYIDALWFVSFSALSGAYRSGAWPHTNNFLNTTPDIFSPVVNMFAWTPFDTLTNTFYSRRSNHAGGRGENYQGDAHTIIHETGHLLGLNDYYSTAPDQSYTMTTNGVNNECKYSPLGGMDMMDQNYLDHNPLSKLLFNWTKPYLVYGNSTITLRPSLYKNEVVVIPYDSLNYSQTSYKNSRNETIFNPYDEYLVLDFFTPDSDFGLKNNTTDNLNTKAYDVYDTQNITMQGIRIYHVDKRGVVAIDTGDKDAEGKKLIGYSQPNDPMELLNLRESEQLACPITNTEFGANSEKGSNNRNGKIKYFDNYCDEIRIMTSNSLEYADSTYCINGNRYDKNASLLKANGVIFSPGSTFNTAKYTSQVSITTYPSDMSADEKRTKLSCFGFTSSFLKDFSQSEFIDFYVHISAGGYTNFGYTNTQYAILTKVYNAYKNNTTPNLTSSEKSQFDNLLSPSGYSRATFNNGKLCSYNISIS